MTSALYIWTLGNRRKSLNQTTFMSNLALLHPLIMRCQLSKWMEKRRNRLIHHLLIIYHCWDYGYNRFICDGAAIEYPSRENRAAMGTVFQIIMRPRSRHISRDISPVSHGRCYTSMLVVNVYLQGMRFTQGSKDYDIFSIYGINPVFPAATHVILNQCWTVVKCEGRWRSSTPSNQSGVLICF